MMWPPHQIWERPHQPVNFAWVIQSEKKRYEFFFILIKISNEYKIRSFEFSDKLLKFNRPIRAVEYVFVLMFINSFIYVYLYFLKFIIWLMIIILN